MGGELSQPAGRDAGVSLIELMVVVAILAVLAVGTGIAAGSAREAQDLSWFRKQFDTSRALAIQNRQSRGLFVAPSGISTARISPDGWNQGAERRWRDPVTFRPVQTELRPRAPEILFLANGQTTAFSITFTAGASCQTDGWTGLICTE